MTHSERAKLHVKIADFIREHNEMTYNEIAAHLGISRPAISKIAIKLGIQRRNAVKHYSASEVLAKLEQVK